MTKNETIARLARRVEKQRLKLKAHKAAARKVHSLIYGIGGPLNDNKLKFSGPQMLEFQKIIDALRGV